MDRLELSDASDPPEVQIHTNLRNWSICTLIWAFSSLLLAIYLIFYDIIDVAAEGFTWTLLLDLGNLFWMLGTAIIGLTASEQKSVGSTCAYFYAISAYAPIFVLYSIVVRENNEFKEVLIVYIGFIALNIVTCMFYVLCGYKLYNAAQKRALLASASEIPEIVTAESQKVEEGVLYTKVPLENH